jgi:outer membrane protein insertion porin family
MRGGRGRVAALLVAAAAATASGQSPPPEPPQAVEPGDLAPFEGRPVRRIVLALAPADPQAAPGQVDERTHVLMRNNLRLAEGAPFAAQIVREDIARLTRLGRFRTVEGRVQQMSDGSVEVSYLVTLHPVIESVQTVGNTELSDEELLGQIGALEGTPVDPNQLERACRRLEAMYRDKGYYNALVTVDDDELTKNQIAVFRVREGARTKVASIRFEGLRSYPPGHVREGFKSEEASLFKTGALDNDKLDEDLASVIKFFKDRGHLDVRADRTLTISPNGREAIVTFIVDEGPVYTLRDVHVEFVPGEEPAFTREQIAALLPVKTGDAYSLDRVQRGLRELQHAYGALGYVDMRADRRELREPGRPLVDLLLTIRQGRPFRTGLVRVAGNTSTRDSVIRERVTLRPDRPLDTGEIDETRQRLAQSRLFLPNSVRITVQPEREEDPGYRDLLVEVTETQTGAFNFGASVGADNGIFGTISVTQRNFDITDFPDSWGELFTGESFHGGGQTFSIVLQPGDRVRNFSIGLSDPYAFDTNYSLGGSLYYRDRLYSAYTERRYGAEVRAGRRYGSQWTLSAPLRYETVELSDIDADAPTAYFDDADSQAFLSAGLVLTRSSFDNLAFPSRGSKIEFGLEQFTGGETFTQVRAEYSRLFRLSENVLGEKTVLQLTTRASYTPQDFEDVPFYHRYFLGGQSLRGFDYRAVSPTGIRNDTGGIAEDTIGGNFMFFLGAEARFPLLTEIVSGVVFVDSGTVNEEFSLDNYRVSAGFGLRIYVEQISPAPLAFDFGFPLLKEDTDQLRLFSFSIDIPFR